MGTQTIDQKLGDFDGRMAGECVELTDDAMKQVDEEPLAKGREFGLRPGAGLSHC